MDVKVVILLVVILLVFVFYQPFSSEPEHISGVTQEQLSDSQTTITNQQELITRLQKNLEELEVKLREAQKAPRTAATPVDQTAATPVGQTPPPKALSNQQAFEEIYNKKQWVGGGSGSGSFLSSTVAVRKFLIEVVQKYNISKMIDVPCGDLVWMPAALEVIEKTNPNFQYLGLDVVRSLIRHHRENLTVQHSNWRFGVCDVALCSLPFDFDLIFSRDVLMHLSYPSIFAYLKNVRDSGAKYFLVNSFLEHHGENRDVVTPTHSHFKINLLEPPFNLPPPLEKFPEGNEKKNG